VQLDTGPIALAPGEEKTLCVFLELPSDVPLAVTGFEQQNRGFAHHFILFRAAAAEPPGVRDCPTGLFTQHPPIYPGTRDQGPFHMPEAVALELDARQPLILQLHLLSTQPAETEERLRMNLHARAADGAYDRAGIVGGSDFDFQIPPQSVHTETQRCVIGGDVEVFALTSHSHARTQSFDVAVVAPSGPKPVYHSADWAEPEVTHYDPTLLVRGGFAGGIEFSCTWKNDDAHAVGYGDTAADEMCMVFGYYFPATLDLLPCVGL
jgi:hypothetical protein